MDPNLQADLEATQSITSYLFSGFQGKHAYYHILSELKSNLYRSGELVMTKSILGKLENWISQLAEGTPLISKTWKGPESTEATAAFDLLNKLKIELIDATEKMTPILTAGDYSSDKEKIALMAALFGRFAYSRDAYIKQHLNYARCFKIEHLEKQYNLLLHQAQTDVQMADSFVDILKNPDRPPREFYLHMREETISLPYIFRTHVHDINQLLAMFEEEFTFQLAEMNPSQAESWKVVNMPPESAGYWQAYGFTPPATVEWRQAGMEDPSEAFIWHMAGFTPKDAPAWSKINVPPRLARQFSSAGITPQQALQELQQQEAATMTAQQKQIPKDKP